MSATVACSLTEQLEKDGFALVPGLISSEQLRSMQLSFAGRLRHMRWNDVDGYEINERYRHFVQDLLALDQGFVDAALDPRVTETLREYVGPRVQLCEAKGWRSIPTRYDFHGWHGDMWYDPNKIEGIPREVKLAIYLTDVKTGFFKFLRGSHGKQAPRNLVPGESDHFDPKDVVEVPGPAGTAFMFDTSCIHRQSVPIEEVRHAAFFNYHEPAVPLRQEEINYYRYHPLLLNAAFLGDLSEEDQRILGFGDKTNYVPHHERQTEHSGFLSIMSRLYRVKLFTGEYRRRIWAKCKRIFRL